MNWGYKIMTVIILFICGMSFMVYVAMKQTNEMIDTNYYEKELNYQQIIQARENLTNISTQNLIAMQDNRLIISLPVEAGSLVNNGSIEFIRMNASEKDVKLAVNTNEAGMQIVEGSRFVSGNYLYRIQWEKNQKQYYKEGYINI